MTECYRKIYIAKKKSYQNLIPIIIEIIKDYITLI